MRSKQPNPKAIDKYHDIVMKDGGCVSPRAAAVSCQHLPPRQCNRAGMP
jgi:hypothetical protein